MARCRENNLSRLGNLGSNARCASLQVLRSYGTIDSVGVAPTGGSQNEQASFVEFSCNIYRNNGCYVGEVYVVDYDAKLKINSNDLIYFSEKNSAEVLCIFRIRRENSAFGVAARCECNCGYELVVSASTFPFSQTTNGKFFAYATALASNGINIGGVLKTGEVRMLGDEENCDCTSTATASENSCTFYRSQEAVTEVEVAENTTQGNVSVEKKTPIGNGVNLNNGGQILLK